MCGTVNLLLPNLEPGVVKQMEGVLHWSSGDRTWDRCRISLCLREVFAYSLVILLWPGWMQTSSHSPPQDQCHQSDTLECKVRRSEIHWCDSYKKRQNARGKEEELNRLKQRNPSPVTTHKLEWKSRPKHRPRGSCSPRPSQCHRGWAVLQESKGKGDGCTFWDSVSSSRGREPGVLTLWPPESLPETATGQVVPAYHERKTSFPSD